MAVLFETPHPVSTAHTGLGFRAALETVSPTLTPWTSSMALRNTEAGKLKPFPDSSAARVLCEPQSPWNGSQCLHASGPFSRGIISMCLSSLGMLLVFP